MPAVPCLADHKITEICFLMSILNREKNISFNLAIINA